MGLSKNSTGIGVLSGEKGKVSDDYKYKIGLAGNPKSKNLLLSRLVTPM